MNILRSFAIVFLWSTALIVGSGGLRIAAASDVPAASQAEPEDDTDRESDWSDGRTARDPDARSHRHGRDLVNIGHDSDLPAGERADSVVSVIGSSSAEGDASDVVSVFGNTTVTGSVRHSAVAVFGNTVIDGPVDGDAVSVLGNVKLGPHALVEGDVVAVGGQVDRDPAAQVRGTVQTVIGSFAGFGWLKPWIQNCLFYGRPLALAPGLGWAWSLALVLLAFYVALAWLFRDGVARCVQTLESQPGITLVAALITVLLTPVLLVLLCITVVGIAAVPFLAAGLFCVSLFGKAVVLAWLGHRALGARGGERFAHPACAVLVGGAIVLVLYLVPVLGFIVYKLLGLFGLGAVVYTLVLITRSRRAEHSHRAAAARPATAFGAAESPVPPDPAATPDPVAPPDPAVPPSRGAAAPVISAAGLPRAGFWVRMAALLLDAVLVGVLMGAFHHASDAELLALATYGAVMWKMRGSTVGGIVFDLQVVRLDDRPVDWETAIIRALGCFLSFVVIGLGFFWIAFDAGKQAWHDKIAGTAVVRVRKGVPLV
jgi:uncharacterized RDD family membrane protein YckC